MAKPGIPLLLAGINRPPGRLESDTEEEDLLEVITEAIHHDLHPKRFKVKSAKQELETIELSVAL